LVPAGAAAVGAVVVPGFVGFGWRLAIAFNWSSAFRAAATPLVFKFFT
jgi:hypothetical protein